ncbi:MAG: hypothetical protein M1400_02915 [Patescibacteria group bacterium]|nr:hypothetical protein [Patescibacteria group bacterium]
MPLLILKILLTLFAIQALVKFFVFFFMGYDERRKQLEKSYGDKTSATKVFDNVILVILLVLVVLLFVSKSMQYISFIAGLYIGATLIQVYFHRFTTPLPPEKSPNPPVSPIKLMSYAIQANPEKPWKEIVFLALLFGWGLYMFATQGFGLFQ